MKSFRCLALLLFFAACAVWISPVDAQTPSDQWTLTTADFVSQPVGLTGIDSGGLHVLPAGSSKAKAVSFDDFLDIKRTGPATGTPTGLVIRLTGGDVLGGGPISLKGDTLLWNSTTVGQVKLSMRQVLSIALADVTLGTDRPTMDVVALANGDSVRGTVSDINDKTVTVITDTNTIPVPIASVKSIVLAASGSPPPAQHGFHVCLDDGAAITAGDISLAGGSVKLTIGKDQPHAVDLQHVLSIEQINGPVSWLSQRPPTANVFTPVFGTSQKFAAQMDRTVTGKPLYFGSQQFVHGIGVHSYSRLAWQLDGSYAAFRTQFAIDGDRPAADVTVRIKLDDKVVYEQQHVRSGVLWPIVSEKLGNAKLLTLEVDFGDNLDAGDHLNWLSPALLKTLPPPAPITTVHETSPATAPSTQDSAAAPAAPATQQYMIGGRSAN